MHDLRGQGQMEIGRLFNDTPERFWSGFHKHATCALIQMGIHGNRNCVIICTTSFNPVNYTYT